MYASFRVLLVVALSISSIVFANTQPQGLGPESTASELDTCSQAKENLEAAEDLEISCLENYHLYLSKDVKSSNSKAKLKIASWNMFNLGSNKQRFKRLDIMAELAEQQNWDVISAVELFPLSQEDYLSNQKLESYIQKLTDSKKIETAKAQFVWPGAVELLRELRKKDSSWSLIMAPRSLGSEGTSATEAGGVYFKASRVQLKQTDACSDLACIAVLPASLFSGLTQDMIDEVVSREPFLASFVQPTTGFDFTILPFHARFRSPKKPGVLEAIVGLEATTSKSVNWGKGLFFDIDDILGKDRADTFRKKWEAEFKAGKFYSAKDGAKEDLSRYAELSAIGRYVKYLTTKFSEKDVFWAGDFNFELNDKSSGVWDTILLKGGNSLKGTSVWVTDLTSLSDKERLASNYDHFVMNEDLSSACDKSSAIAIDFISKDEPKSLKAFETYSNLNEDFVKDMYDDLPLTPSNLLALANKKADEYQNLPTEKRLGVSLARAQKINAMPADQQQTERAKLEEQYLKTVKQTFDDLVAKKKYKSLKDIETVAVEDYANSLLDKFDVLLDTLKGSDGKNHRVYSFQRRFPKDDEVTSPEDQARRDEYDSIVQDFERRVYDSQWMVDPAGGKPIRYQMYREILSDHLPIEMNCGN